MVAPGERAGQGQVRTSRCYTSLTMRTRNGPAVSDGDTSVLDEDRGSHQALGLVANKWTVLGIHVLADGTRRYGDLQREIGGVSQ